MLTMNDAKASAIKNLSDVAGQQFETPKGVIGTILPNLSERGKIQAELTCSFVENGANCTETHIREISDWHQCDKCRTHKKSKSKGGGAVAVDGGTQRPMKLLDVDSPEVRAQKEAYNATLEQIQALEKAERDAKRAVAAEERKVKADADKQVREAERAAKQAAAVAERLAKIKQVAAEKGLGVSARTLVAAGE